MTSNINIPALTLEELVYQLAMRRSETDHAALLGHWLSEIKSSHLSLSLALLFHHKPAHRITIPALKISLFEKINPDLFAASKEAGSDLCETLALLWPGGSDAFDPVRTWSALSLPDPDERRKALCDQLSGANALARDMAIRLATGRFKSPVKPDVLRAALALRFSKPLKDVEKNLANARGAFDIFARWLEGEPFPDALTHETGFMGIPPLQSRDITCLLPEDRFTLVPRGRCLVLITRASGSRFYTRTGDLIEETAQTFDLPPNITALVFRPENPEAPLQILDVLRNPDESPVEISASMISTDHEPFTPFEDPAIHRLLLPPAQPGHPWGEITRPPHILYLPLLYANGPVSRRGHFSGDVTLGTCTLPMTDLGSDTLVPVGKAAINQLSSADSQILEAFISKNTLERFGPTRKLAVTTDTYLIAKITCRTIDMAPRRKAGLVLIDAQLVEIMENLSACDVSTLDDLAMLALL